MGRARENEERGRGVPLSDAERVARHYGISLEEACEWLTYHTVDELIPERGAGLTGIGQESGVGFWSELGSFVKQYPLQVSAVGVATVAVLVNIKSTRSMIRALQVGK